MKLRIMLLLAGVSLAAATAASLSANLVSVTDAIVAPTDRPAYVTAPVPGYIVYSDNAAALPDPTCYWTRVPVYGGKRDVIGWRGRAVAVCPQAQVSAQKQQLH
jgi:hypothetical protein